MDFKKIMFWVGISMIAYDMLGHMLCATARKNSIMNGLWNQYSRFIWPSWFDNFQYDLFWSTWFMLSIILIIVGKK